MEDFSTRHTICLLLAASSWLGTASVEAQTPNAWTSSVSGYWEDPDWSLGTLPGPNQAILFTNAGWKALAIGPNTAQNYPQTMDVDSITVSSPTNSFNTLLLNYAGYQTPLTANAITLGSNTVMTILASLVNVTNTGNSNYCFEVGGTVNQGEFSGVNASLLRLGDIGPGIYNLTNGTLTVVTGYVGGAFSGQFNQFGGYNSVTTLTILGGRGRVGVGEYDLYDGALGGTVDLVAGALMKQSGGIFVGSVSLDGTYELDGGSFTNSNLMIPPTYNGFTDDRGLAGEVLQTGGTNQTGSIFLGGEAGGYDPYSSAVPGSYVLSNGLLVATSAFLDVGGSVTQASGIFTNSGQLALGADLLHVPNGFEFVYGQYVLQGGFLAEESIVSSGYFTQSGGTNQVAGTTLLTSIDTSGLGGELAQFTLSGGLFATTSMNVFDAAIYQSGGSLLTGNLSLSNSIAPNSYERQFSGYVLSGGQLTVSSVQLDGYVVFRHQGGTLQEPGPLTLAGGLWDEQTSGQQFGPLQVSSAYNLTNSTVSLPANSCILQFADSSAVAWTGGVTLLITNWAGSTQGGGRHQIIFGSNSSALTAAQLSDIVFANPAGLPGGRYPARILSSGEIVPMTITPPVAGAPVRQANGTMDLLVSGDVGKVYGMSVSTDLVHWAVLSIQTNQSGTMTFQDPAAPSFPQRFYRAYQQ